MDYANGKIYKITGGGMTYYGSTTQALSKRMYFHKYKLECSSKIIIETGEAVIVLVEGFPCKSKEELFSRERWFIENHECVNKYIPTRTRKEYVELNKEQISEYQKEYRQINIEQKKEYYEANKEKISEQQKQYYEANKEKISEQQKQYNEANKEHIREKRRQRYLKSLAN